MATQTRKRNRRTWQKLLQPIKLSCSDHEGGGAVRFQQWDGQKWVTISDWVRPDRTTLRPIIEESAAKFAKEKGIKPRDCARESAHASR